MTPRVNRDAQVNIQGKLLIDLCISSGIRIVNGRHNGDPTGNFTCHTPSVVDYMVMSDNLFPNVIKFSVDDLPLYSDYSALHLAVHLLLKHNNRERDKEKVQTITQPIMKPLLWNEQSRLRLIQTIERSNEQIQELHRQVSFIPPNQFAKNFQ